MSLALLSDWITWTIPLVSALIGWFTNVVAVEMMFRPLDFIGIQPWLGWQGIVPRHARALAGRSTDLITTKLLSLRGLFEGFDAAGFSGQLGRAIDAMVDRIVADGAAEYAPKMWAQMTDPVRDQVRSFVRREVEAMTIDILSDMRDSIEEIIDLKAIVMSVAERNRKLIGDMFLTVGSREFQFIRRSGAYFGLPFGVFQMFCWVVYPAWWTLPVFGFLVGYVTNWLAIKLIFDPAQPRRIGPFVIHGMFHKRQREVAGEFARIVASDVLSPPNMVERMVTGATGERLFAIVDRRVTERLERYREHPAARMFTIEGGWDAVLDKARAQVRDELPRPGGFLHTFVERSIDVHGELFNRMSQLDSESFEGVLRPAFQKDEWKLIVAGGALGAIAGAVQAVYML